MRRNDIATAFCTFGLLACTAPESERSYAVASITTTTECSGAYCYEVADEPEFGAACPDTVQIGYLKSVGLCPPAGPNWQRSFVFGAAAPAQMRRYCRYEWIGAAATPNVGAIPSNPFQGLAPDCNVVSPQGHPFEELNAAALETAYHRQIDALSAYPGRVAATPTKVVVVDSSVDTPFPHPGTGRLEHGQVIGELIRNVACPTPGPDCMAEVSSELALPLVRNVHGELVYDETAGGYLGSQGYLAAAIYSGVTRALDFPGDDRVVVNMSLGWDDHWGGDYPGDSWDTLDPPVQAVHAALMHAACQGAIIVAAAGNKIGGPSGSTGPAYPAAWEKKDAPSAAACIPYGGQTGPASSSPYQPLLYAAGGVDGRDAPLAGARVDGTPALVGPADHVAVTRATLTGVEASATYTGTSIAGAAVSSVAAIAWSYFPNESNHDIMARIHASGVPLARAPEFCNAKSCPISQSRVSACQTTRDACTELHLPCSVQACELPNRDARVDFADLDFSDSSVPRDLVVDLGQPDIWEVIPRCGTVYTSTSYIPDNPCPAQQYYNQHAAPYSTPQPNVPVCPECFAFANGDITLGLGTDFGGVLSEPTITVVTESGDEVYPVFIDSSELVEGATIDIDNTGIDFSEALKATFDVLIDDEEAHSDALMIEDIED